MAKLTINGAGKASVTMDNGKPVPVADDYEGISLYSGVRVDLITFPDGGELWFPSYRSALIDGLAGDLADGETFTSHDGTTWTRYGAEMVVRAPGKVEATEAYRTA